MPRLSLVTFCITISLMKVTRETSQVLGTQHDRMRSCICAWEESALWTHWWLYVTLWRQSEATQRCWHWVKRWRGSWRQVRSCACVHACMRACMHECVCVCMHSACVVVPAAEGQRKGPHTLEQQRGHAVTQVWGNSLFIAAQCGTSLFCFDDFYAAEEKARVLSNQLIWCSFLHEPCWIIPEIRIYYTPCSVILP